MPFVIGNTLGRGMSLRRAPASSEIGKVWPDGTAMAGLGAEQDAYGWTWIWVRDPEGSPGWVQNRFLVKEGEPPAPADGSTAPITPPPAVIPALAGTPTISGSMLPTAAPSTPTVIASTAAGQNGTVVLAGSSSTKTRPFFLPSGHYTIAWQGVPSDGSSYFSGTLSAVDASKHELFMNDIIKGTRRGETQAYGLKPGQYYLEMSLHGDWKVAIVPQGQDAQAALDGAPTVANQAPASAP